MPKILKLLSIIFLIKKHLIDFCTVLVSKNSATILTRKNSLKIHLRNCEFFHKIPVKFQFIIYAKWYWEFFGMINNNNFFRNYLKLMEKCSFLFTRAF
ncbi:hypothetical protein BpHYR1_005743 [Brachionus plicatilis]|uniref:Uncharacterized protein n=1 Tax=Brachionus plicatilis TaxID=10195 RepID=A0A3M7S236_BRAPC|nr:hypothetical protein BpHYR1_005743 [Brachionus plicatilis]